MQRRTRESARLAKQYAGLAREANRAGTRLGALDRQEDYHWGGSLTGNQEIEYELVER
jgi:hypothetical protein